jgi:hypothetical protein
MVRRKRRPPRRSLRRGSKPSTKNRTTLLRKEGVAMSSASQYPCGWRGTRSRKGRVQLWHQRLQSSRREKGKHRRASTFRQRVLAAGDAFRATRLAVEWPRREKAPRNRSPFCFCGLAWRRGVSHLRRSGIFCVPPQRSRVGLNCVAPTGLVSDGECRGCARRLLFLRDGILRTRRNALVVLEGFLG